MATPSGGRPPDPRATGQVLKYERKGGLTSWYLRVRAYGKRHRINLGTELDGWTETRARIELQNVLAKIQAGIWEPPAPQSPVKQDPTFHEFASSSLKRRKPTFNERTYEHYRYLLTNHLLPRFARLRLSQIDYGAIDRYIEPSNWRARSARKRPLSNSTINATVDLLSGIPDDVVRRKFLATNR